MKAHGCFLRDIWIDLSARRWLGQACLGECVTSEFLWGLEVRFDGPSVDVICCGELEVRGKLKQRDGLHLSTWPTLKWPSVRID